MRRLPQGLREQGPAVLLDRLRLPSFLVTGCTSMPSSRLDRPFSTSWKMPRCGCRRRAGGRNSCGKPARPETTAQFPKLSIRTDTAACMSVTGHHLPACSTQRHRPHNSHEHHDNQAAQPDGPLWRPEYSQVAIARAFFPYSGARDGRRMAETCQSWLRDLKGLGVRQPGRHTRTRQISLF